MEEVAAKREAGCKKSAEEIGQALIGSWCEENLFILKQSLEIFDIYTRQVEACDAEIGLVYALTWPDWEVGKVKPTSWRKQNSHSKNRPSNPEASESI